MGAAGPPTEVPGGLSATGVASRAGGSGVFWDELLGEEPLEDEPLEDELSEEDLLEEESLEDELFEEFWAPW